MTAVMSMVANAKMLEIKSPGNWDASPVAQALIYNLIICLFILMLSCAKNVVESWNGAPGSGDSFTEKSNSHRLLEGYTEDRVRQWCRHPASNGRSVDGESSM